MLVVQIIQILSQKIAKIASFDSTVENDGFPLLFVSGKKLESDDWSFGRLKMMMKWYLGRFLLRQYIYPLICFLLLLLLIKWNSQPQKIIIEHEKWHDEAEKQIQKIKIDELPKVSLSEQIFIIFVPSFLIN